MLKKVETRLRQMVARNMPGDTRRDVTQSSPARARQRTDAGGDGGGAGATATAATTAAPPTEERRMLLELMTRNTQMGTMGMPMIREDTGTAPMAGVRGYGTPAPHGTATSFAMPPMPGWGEYAQTGISNATWTQNVTIMRFWFEFCELEGGDPTEFGKVQGDEAPRPSQLAWADEVLARFSVYVTENPRKKGQTHNTGNTAGGYVSHVRAYYEFRLDPPRRVGGSGVSEAKGGLGHALRRCLKGLRKLHPSDPNHRKKTSVLRIPSNVITSATTI